jgi:hypothetical protein
MSTLYKDYRKTMQEVEIYKNNTVRYNCTCFNLLNCTCNQKPLQPYQQVEMMMQGIDPDDDFGTIDINWDDYDPNPWQWEGDAQPPTLRCAHQWKATTLITSTVYDCTKCGIKKEKVDSSIKL